MLRWLRFPINYTYLLFFDLYQIMLRYRVLDFISIRNDLPVINCTCFIGSV